MKYDNRLRFLQARSQTQQTADNRQVIVEAYCTWRVDNPLKFFQSYGNAGARSSYDAQAVHVVGGNRARPLVRAAA